MGLSFKQLKIYKAPPTAERQLVFAHEKRKEFICNDRTAYFHSVAQQEAYQELDVEAFEVVATLKNAIHTLLIYQIVK